MLVIDASVAFVACANENGFDEFHGERLAAPALMWSETRSAIRERLWRGEIGNGDAQAMHHRLERCAVEACSPAGLGVRAWEVAAEMGWAKTYDAEYIALAQVLNCQLLTVDMRLRRGTQRLGCVITPDDLVAPDPTAAEPDDEG
jgi:predicted nucleic acid-binding protein